jgi:hypothetical protein
MDVGRNMQTSINIFLFFRRQEKILSKPPCIYFQFHGVIFFAGGILLLLLLSLPFSITIETCHFFTAGQQGMYPGLPSTQGYCGIVPFYILISEIDVP